LVAAGFPLDVASRLAAETTAERKDGGEFLCPMGVCVPAGDNAVESLVDSVLAENAEANDRTTHAERGDEPLWPLPSRRPRSG
jgi:hypothetical protein